MNKTKIWTIVALVVLISGITVVYNLNRTPTSFAVAETKTVTDQNDWSIFVSAPDSVQVVSVCYQEKYGTLKTIYCKVVFENAKTGEYKCIAPWLGDLILQKSNLNSFQTKIVLKTEMK